MNLISEAQIQYLREEAKKALAQQVNNAQFYYKKGEAEADAAEQATGAERERHIANAKKFAEMSQRIENDAESLSNLIDAQQAFITAQQASAQAYGTERYIAGCNTAQAAREDAPKNSIQRYLDMERIGAYNAERYGSSTEGQWKTPMILMRDGSIRPKYKQKINLAQYHKYQ
jgi:hypothetical protein